MTPKSPNPAVSKEDDPDQSRRFIEIAEAEGADKDVLKEAVKKLAPHRREPPKTKRSAKA